MGTDRSPTAHATCAPSDQRSEGRTEPDLEGLGLCRGRLLARLLAGAVLVAGVAGCPPARTPAPPAPGGGPGVVPRPTDLVRLDQLAGGWTWLHGSTEDGTYRLEREQWRLDPPSTDPGTGAPVVTGRYRRDVAIVALDATPFVCNQQAAYTQTAWFDVRATIADGALAIEEVAVTTAPSPCEPGERALGRYAATRDGETLVLAWDGGTQRLGRAGALADDAALAGPGAPDGAGALAGAWHWELRGRDRVGDVRDEDEAWELAVGADGAIGGSYVRTVTVHRGDGQVMACAGAPSYTYVDRVTVRGRLGDDGVAYIEEVAVDPGTHPCLAGEAGERHLDTGSATVVGDHVVITWRGARPQVLHRDPRR